MRKIWLLQFVANALIVFGFYEWLGIRDSRASQLILSFLLGLAILAGTVFLHSRTFHMRPLRFSALLLIFILIYWGLNMFPLEKWGLWIASSVTYHLRKPVKPDVVVRTLSYLRLFVQCIVAPLLLLQRPSPRFWLLFAGVIAGAFFIPSVLIHWTPKLTSTALQVTSFVLRFGLAYCLTVTGFVAFWRMTSGGNPVRNQPNTAALP